MTHSKAPPQRDSNERRIGQKKYIYISRERQVVGTKNVMHQNLSHFVTEFLKNKETRKKPVKFSHQELLTTLKGQHKKSMRMEMEGIAFQRVLKIVSLNLSIVPKTQRTNMTGITVIA